MAATSFGGKSSRPQVLGARIDHGCFLTIILHGKIIFCHYRFGGLSSILGSNERPRRKWTEMPPLANGASGKGLTIHIV
jgi:hypothetical protein